MPLLRIRNLSVDFTTASGQFRAVDGVDQDVNNGEILAIVGESGSGKSVSMLAVMGLLPWTATVTADLMEFDGHDLAQLGAQARRRIVGKDLAMIFQEPQTALNPTKTIGAQMLKVIGLHTGKRGKAAREHALSLLRDMRINDAEEILERYPFELSGGMRQRILIGLAFACSPKLLVADEPTTALDVTVQRQVLQLMHGKARATGAAVLFISHDLAVVSQFCDRLYVMYAGSVVETGPTAQVLNAPAHPYTQALIRALPESATRGEPLNSIPGTVPNLTALPAGCAFRERCQHAFERCGAVPELFGAATDSHRSACWLMGEKERAKA